MPKLLTDWSPQAAKRVTWLFTDVDDTLTWRGKLPAETLDAMQQLSLAGINVVPVTGACAGWCDQIARLWPVHGVIGENGAFWITKRQQQFHHHYCVPFSEMRKRQRYLLEQVKQVLASYPGLTLANDQSFRFCDVAVNIAQDRTPLSAELIEELLLQLRQLTVFGDPVQATESSIHINVWTGNHSKRSSSQSYLSQALSGEVNQEEVAYVGDSCNDEPMFSWINNSVGVNNITPYLPKLACPPQYMTRQNGGYGFAELAHFLLSAKE